MIWKSKETKYKYYSEDTQAVLNAGVLQDLTAIAQGDNFDERDGNKIFSTRFTGRFTVEAPSTGRGILRVILYRPIDPDDDMQTDVIGISDQINPKKYFVYSDRYFNLNADSISSRNFNFNQRLRNTVNYQSTTSTSANKNPLMLYMVSDKATDGPVVNGTGYLWFKDL